jgi:hypothetical protein
MAGGEVEASCAVSDELSREPRPGRLPGETHETGEERSVGGTANVGLGASSSEEVALVSSPPGALLASVMPTA